MRQRREEEMVRFPLEMHYLASRNCGERSPVLEWVRTCRELQKAFPDRSNVNTFELRVPVASNDTELPHAGLVRWKGEPVKHCASVMPESEQAADRTGTWREAVVLDDKF